MSNNSLVDLLAAFMASRFIPDGKELDEPYSFVPDATGERYIVEKTWGQHLQEAYTVDAEALIGWLKVNGLEIR